MGVEGKTDNFAPVPDRWVSSHRQNLGFSRVSRLSRLTVCIRVSVRLTGFRLRFSFSGEKF